MASAVRSNICHGKIRLLNQLVNTSNKLNNVSIYPWMGCRHENLVGKSFV